MITKIVTDFLSKGRKKNIGEGARNGKSGGTYQCLCHHPSPEVKELRYRAVDINISAIIYQV